MPASGSNCIHVCQISKKRFDTKDILTSLQNAVWNEIYALAVSTIGPHLSSLTTNRDTMVQTRRQQAEQGNVAPQQPSPEKPAPKKAVPKKPVVKKPAVKKPVVKKPTPQQPINRNSQHRNSQHSNTQRRQNSQFAQSQGKLRNLRSLPTTTTKTKRRLLTMQSTMTSRPNPRQEESERLLLSTKARARK